MTKVELATIEDVVETEPTEFELSLAELDFVGGGTIGSILQ
jgi:hypothetical protein